MECNRDNKMEILMKLFKQNEQLIKLLKEQNSIIEKLNTQLSVQDTLLASKDQKVENTIQNNKSDYPLIDWEPRDDYEIEIIPRHKFKWQQKKV